MADKEQVALAKEVIAAAKEHNIYEGPVPDDADKCVAEAAQIVEQARDAYEANVKGTAVTAVMKAAKLIDGDGDAAPASKPSAEASEPWDSFDSDKPKDVIEKFKSGDYTREQVEGFIEYEKENNERGKIVNFDLDEVPAADPPIESSGDIESIIPDYDNLGWKEVVATFESGKLTADQIRAVQAYEAGDEGSERAKIIKFDPDSVKSAEPSEDPSKAADVGDRSVDDIIDDYAKRRASTVLKKVEELAKDNNTGDLRVMLEWEKSDEGKKREQIIDAISEKLLEKGELVNSAPQTDGDAELDAAADGAVARDDERDDRAPINPLRNAQLSETEHRERVLAELKKAGFQAPEVPDEDEYPQMPREVSELSDDALNQLMVDFNAWFALASYKLALASVDEEHFRRVADHHARVILVGLPKINADTDKPKTELLLTAEVEQHEKVAPWREAQSIAHENVVLYRAEKDLLKGGYDALSRILTYRLDERERAGNRR